MVELPESVQTANGVTLVMTEVSENRDGLRLHEEFNRLLAAGEGYPQDGPISYEEFGEYWLEAKTLVVAAWLAQIGSFVGSYFLKPNGAGRAAHVANAGYFVVAEHRGAGIGETLVRHSMALAAEIGFDALQYNFVFESNPARRLYERMGFLAVGRIPDVIDGEAVYIYWKRLDGGSEATPPALRGR